MNRPSDIPTPVDRAPEYVRAIAPYVGGKPIEEVARELDLDPATIVKLASNENPRGASPKVQAAIAAAVAELTRYPDGNGFALKAALAKRLRVQPEQIVLGNGSNDVLELVTHAFLRPGDHAVYSQYAFIVYPLATRARGAIGIEVSAKDYGHDLDAMQQAITPKTRVVFIANPNNPTGTWLAGHVVERFVAAVPRDVIVVLDEAYNEFLDPANQSDSTAWTSRYPNLVVSHTFSKAHGLAGLRVGYGVMDAAIADLLNRVRQPFNVNGLAQAAALAALDDEQYVEDSRVLNRQGMRRIDEGLRALGLRFLPSHGNFVLFEVRDAGAIFQSLLRQGVIVRPVANYGLPSWLRVTIGTPRENERFLAALRKALEPSSTTTRAH
jgi:histidinol-phosphate aminotransferase